MAFPSAPEDWEDREAELAIAKPEPPVSLPLTRLQYLRLLIDGYHKDGNLAPKEYRDEYYILALEEAVMLAKKAQEAEEARKAEFERQTAPEAALEEHWSNQRQFGKNEAARRWAERHGVPLPEIIEVAETEEEMRDAIRNLKRNVDQAKRVQGFRKKHGEEPF